SRMLPPSPATPGFGCLQLRPAAATARRWTVSHLHPEQQRLVAHTNRQYRRWSVTAQSTRKKAGGQHRRGLGAQELPPGGVGVPLGRRGYLQRLEDPADGG